jgi:putative membrane protein
MSSSSFRPQFRLPLSRRNGTLLKVLGITAVSAVGLVMAIQQARAEGLPHKDKAFLEHAAEAGNAEVEASKLALEKTANPDVKTFATLMIDEHTTVGDRLKKLATTKNLKVPDRPGVTQRAKIAILGKLDGATFDEQYVSTIGVSAHKDAVDLFKKGATESKDAEVKDFAAKTLPNLEHHLEMANALKAKLDAKK